MEKTNESNWARRVEMKLRAIRHRHENNRMSSAREGRERSDDHSVAADAMVHEKITWKCREAGWMLVLFSQSQTTIPLPGGASGHCYPRATMRGGRPSTADCSSSPRPYRVLHRREPSRSIGLWPALAGNFQAPRIPS
jgi:hypothetical protein